MPELVKVRRKAQITLPHSVRQALNIEEGDFLEVRVRDGELVLRVKKLVDKEEARFSTERRQEDEKEAGEPIGAGLVQPFSNAKEATAYLRKRAREGFKFKP